MSTGCSTFLDATYVWSRLMERYKLRSRLWIMKFEVTVDFDSGIVEQ